MHAGALRERIRIETLVTGRDQYGNPAQRWGDMDPALVVRARIKPLGGSEQVRAERVEASTKYEITIRYSSAAAAIQADTHRAVNARTGEIYNIHAVVDPSERQKWLIMTCTAGKADA